MTRRLMLAGLAAAALCQPATAWADGDLAKYPPTELQLDITTGPDKAPVLSAREFTLSTGKYYRMNVKSDGVVVWRVEAPDLLEASHLRIVTIAGIEVQMQSLAFRAIEFDSA